MPATKTKLIASIENLSAEEQQRLEDSLEPVLKARKALLHCHRVEIPADLEALKKINEQRVVAVETDDQIALAQLDLELKDIRAKINGVSVDGWSKGGHKNKKIELTEAFKKSKENFARCY